MLERRWRIAAIGETVRAQCGERGCIGTDDSIGAGPGVAPAQPARAERSREGLVGLHQVARASHGSGPTQLERGLERSEIVFGVVDGVARIGGRRPIETRRSGTGGALLEFAQGREAAFGGANHFQRIERRHARPGLRNVHARIRDDQALGRDSGGGAEQHAFTGNALVLCSKAGREFDALFVQQKRIFEGAAREKSFREPGQEDDIETASARFLDGADEDAAVAALGRFGAQKAQAFGENVVDFVERSRANLAHGFQLTENAEHGFGMAER